MSEFEFKHLRLYELIDKAKNGVAEAGIELLEIYRDHISQKKDVPEVLQKYIANCFSDFLEDNKSTLSSDKRARIIAQSLNVNKRKSRPKNDFFEDYLIASFIHGHVSLGITINDVCEMQYIKKWAIARNIDKPEFYTIYDNLRPQLEAYERSRD